MTESSYLAAVRESYDTVAAAYAELIRPPAELDPLSRALLAAFAETVRGAAGARSPTSAAVRAMSRRTWPGRAWTRSVSTCHRE